MLTHMQKQVHFKDTRTGSMVANVDVTRRSWDCAALDCAVKFIGSHLLISIGLKNFWDCKMGLELRCAFIS